MRVMNMNAHGGRPRSTSLPRLKGSTESPLSSSSLPLPNSTPNPAITAVSMPPMKNQAIRIRMVPRT